MRVAKSQVWQPCKKKRSWSISSEKERERKKPIRFGGTECVFYLFGEREIFLERLRERRWRRSRRRRRRRRRRPTITAGRVWGSTSLVEPWARAISQRSSLLGMSTPVTTSLSRFSIKKRFSSTRWSLRYSL